MSKKKEEGEGAPKKSGKMKLIVGAVALLGLGAGGAYGAVAMGYIGAHAEGAEEPDVPQLVERAPKTSTPLLAKAARAKAPLRLNMARAAANTAPPTIALRSRSPPIYAIPPA